MERLLKDCLVERRDESGMYYSMICKHCGSIWNSQTRHRDKAELTAGKDAAAKEAGSQNQVCNFCGQAACRKCFVNIDGIQLCIQCGNRLKARLKCE